MPMPRYTNATMKNVQGRLVIFPVDQARMIHFRVFGLRVQDDFN